MDYVGISGLIAASVMGISYYGFYCKPQVASAYMVFSATCGVVGMILPWVSVCLASLTSSARKHRS